MKKALTCFFPVVSGFREQVYMSLVYRDTVFNISFHTIIPVRACKNTPLAFLSVYCVTVYPPSAFTPLVSIPCRYFYYFFLSCVTVARVRDTVTETV